MNRSVNYLMTLIGGAALPSIAIPVMQTKFDEVNMELEGKLNEANGRIENPTQQDLGVFLNNSFIKSSSSWQKDISVTSVGMSLTHSGGVKCMSFDVKNSHGKKTHKYYLCRNGV